MEFAWRASRVSGANDSYNFEVNEVVGVFLYTLEKKADYV